MKSPVNLKKGSMEAFHYAEKQSVVANESVRYVRGHLIQKNRDDSKFESFFYRSLLKRIQPMETSSACNIQISPSFFAKLRKQAKVMKKEHGIRHFEALDRIARQHGFINWDSAAAVKKDTVSRSSLNEGNSR